MDGTAEEFAAEAGAERMAQDRARAMARDRMMRALLQGFALLDARDQLDLICALLDAHPGGWPQPVAPWQENLREGAWWWAQGAPRAEVEAVGLAALARMTEIEPLWGDAAVKRALVALSGRLSTVDRAAFARRLQRDA